MPTDANGDKWACEPCIRGHRSTKCEHYDRFMMRVKKPGRPLSSCPHPRNSCSCGRERVMMVKIARGATTTDSGCVCVPKYQVDENGRTFPHSLGLPYPPQHPHTQAPDTAMSPRSQRAYTNAYRIGKHSRSGSAINVAGLGRMLANDPFLEDLETRFPTSQAFQSNSLIRNPSPTSIYPPFLTRPFGEVERRVTIGAIPMQGLQDENQAPYTSEQPGNFSALIKQEYDRNITNNINVSQPPMGRVIPSQAPNLWHTLHDSVQAPCHPPNPYARRAISIHENGLMPTHRTPPTPTVPSSPPEPQFHNALEWNRNTQSAAPASCHSQQACPSRLHQNQQQQQQTTSRPPLASISTIQPGHARQPHVVPSQPPTPNSLTHSRPSTASNSTSTTPRPTTADSTHSIPIPAPWANSAGGCNCGPDCACLMCPVHPYNEATLQHIAQLGGILDADVGSTTGTAVTGNGQGQDGAVGPVSAGGAGGMGQTLFGGWGRGSPSPTFPYSTAGSRRPVTSGGRGAGGDAWSRPGSSCSGSSTSAANTTIFNNNDPAGRASNGSYSSNGQNPNAASSTSHFAHYTNNHTNSAMNAHTDLSSRLRHHSTATFSDYFTLEFPFAQDMSCSDPNGTCMCDEDCSCIGCLTHKNNNNGMGGEQTGRIEELGSSADGEHESVSAGMEGEGGEVEVEEGVKVEGEARARGSCCG